MIRSFVKRILALFALVCSVPLLNVWSLLENVLVSPAGMEPLSVKGTDPAFVSSSFTQSTSPAFVREPGKGELGRPALLLCGKPLGGFSCELAPQ